MVNYLRIKKRYIFIFLLLISNQFLSKGYTFNNRKLFKDELYKNTNSRKYNKSLSTLTYEQLKNKLKNSFQDKKFYNLNTLNFLAQNEILNQETEQTKNNEVNIDFKTKTEVLSEVVIKGQKIREFQLKRLKDVEGTEIYSGKKTEVILVDQSMANLASNNARQIYNQISGLNIYQNDDAGIQLHIGGRGLDPNRTSNFNTRQNSYDISADVLGYPESYYTPPAEAIKEIQIVRGAASLQYGTQFGGLINFVLKEPPNKKIDAIIRNTIGSNNQYTNFTSLGGKKK